MAAIYVFTDPRKGQPADKGEVHQAMCKDTGETHDPSFDCGDDGKCRLWQTCVEIGNLPFVLDAAGYVDMAKLDELFHHNERYARTPAAERENIHKYTCGRYKLRMRFTSND